MQTPVPANSWLHRFALLTAAVTFLLLGVGGLVTSHGVGMAVPDWPNTYGYNMFAFPVSQWVGGIFYEHSHRLIASAVGLLTAILATWLWVRETRERIRWAGFGVIFATLVLMGVRRMPVYLALAGLSLIVIGFALWRFRQDSAALRWLGIAALAAVILQGVLGGLRVVWFADHIGIFHATLAQIFFVLICALALLTHPSCTRWFASVASSQPAVRKLRRLVLATTLLILGQLVLGATMRHQHAGLAIPDFPLAYGKLWPAMDAESVLRYNQQRVEVTAAHPITALQIGLQMAHRALALAIFIAVVVVARRASRINVGPLRRLAWGWFGLILAQVGLGAWTIWSNKAADVATAHVLVGALSLVTGALWCIISFASPAAQNGFASISTKARGLEQTAFHPQRAEAVGK